MGMYGNETTSVNKDSSIILTSFSNSIRTWALIKRRQKFKQDFLIALLAIRFVIYKCIRTGNFLMWNLHLNIRESFWGMMKITHFLFMHRKGGHGKISAFWPLIKSTVQSRLCQNLNNCATLASFPPKLTQLSFLSG